MADLAKIRDALAQRLNAVPGLEDRALALVPDSPNAPCIFIEAADPFIDYDLVMARGADTFHFKATLLVSRVSEREGQTLLDLYCTTISIKDALEADWPEGDVAHYAEAKGVTDYGSHLFGDVAYLGCSFNVDVVA